jgi:GNAT superfamily N-acetyltransferase
MPRTQERPAPAVTIVPADRKDADRIGDFVAGLSLRTQFQRFFAGVARPGPGLLRALAGADGRADVLLAVDAAGAVVGHGMAVDQPRPGGGHAVDLGLVVADGWQRQGVGAALLAALVGRAADRGARELVMDVLPGNAAMLGMIARRWPGAPREYQPDSVTIRVPLPAAYVGAA